MLTDGHCHPTDDPSSLSLIGELDCQMAAMSTRFDDVDLVAQQASRYPGKVIPAFGLHPWFSHMVTTDTTRTKFEHYSEILDPSPPQDDPVLVELPDPLSLEDHVDRLRHLLVEHPNALVGEVGLDKAFKIKIGSQISRYRVKLEHQRLVLRRQLELAAELHRSVSLHGVQAPQPLFDEVALFAGRKPSYRGELGNVCLHSYGGSAEFFINHWQRQLTVKVFLSIAVLINGRMQPEKLRAMLRGASPQCVLSESDYNRAGGDQLDLVRQSVDIFAEYFGMPYAEMEHQLELNFREYIHS